MTGLWFIQRRTHNAGIVDAGWAAAHRIAGDFLCGNFRRLSPSPHPRSCPCSCLGIPPLLLYTDRSRIGTTGRRTVRLTAQKNGALPPSGGFSSFIKVRLCLRFSSHFRRWSSRITPCLIGLDGIWRAPDLGVRCRKHYWPQTVSSVRFRTRPENRARLAVPAGGGIPGIPITFFLMASIGGRTPLLPAGAGFWWVSWLVPFGFALSVFRVTGIRPRSTALASRGEDYRSYQRKRVCSSLVPGRKAKINEWY